MNCRRLPTVDDVRKAYEKHRNQWKPHEHPVWRVPLNYDTNSIEIVSSLSEIFNPLPAYAIIEYRILRNYHKSSGPLYHYIVCGTVKEHNIEVVLEQGEFYYNE